MNIFGIAMRRIYETQLKDASVITLNITPAALYIPYNSSDFGYLV